MSGEEITEEAALDLLEPGFQKATTHPACIVFELYDDRTLTYWRSSDDYGDSWVLDSP